MQPEADVRDSELDDACAREITLRPTASAEAITAQPKAASRSSRPRTIAAGPISMLRLGAGPR